jgi:hypothetical protein
MRVRFPPPAPSFPLIFHPVTPAHSRSKNGGASLAYVAGIHVLTPDRTEDADGRDEARP